MNKIETGPIINPFKIVTRTIMRFYLVLFTVIVAGGLILAIITLNDILTNPQVSNKPLVQDTQDSNQEIITIRLNKLYTSSTNNTYLNITPTAKTNPFSE